MTTIQRLSDLDATPHETVFPGSEPKTVRLALDEGEQVPPHRHEGREIVLYLVEGAVELQVGPETHELRGGDAARFSGDQEVSPTATEESVALIVLAVAPD